MPGFIRKVSREGAKCAKCAIISIVYSFILYFFFASFAVLCELCVKSSLPSSLFPFRFSLSFFEFSSQRRFHKNEFIASITQAISLSVW